MPFPLQEYGHTAFLFMSISVCKRRCIHHFAVAPDSLEIIEDPLVFREYMNNNIIIVHQDPVGASVSLNVSGLIAGFSQRFLYAVRQCLYLQYVRTAGNDI